MLKRDSNVLVVKFPEIFIFPLQNAIVNIDDRCRIAMEGETFNILRNFDLNLLEKVSWLTKSIFSISDWPERLDYFLKFKTIWVI